MEKCPRSVHRGFKTAASPGPIVRSQPRSQALSSMRRRGGKTLVQAGHVSPRFWETTKILREGW